MGVIRSRDVAVGSQSLAAIAILPVGLLFLGEFLRFLFGQDGFLAQLARSFERRTGVVFPRALEARLPPRHSRHCRGFCGRGRSRLTHKGFRQEGCHHNAGRYGTNQHETFAHLRPSR